MIIKRLAYVLGLAIIISGCGIYGLTPESMAPFSADAKWKKKGTSIQETRKIMKGCGYPSPDGAASEPDNNKIALMQLCMEKNGFKYTGKLGTFCKNYPLLPACAEGFSIRSENKKGIHISIPVNVNSKTKVYMNFIEPENFNPATPLDFFYSGKKDHIIFLPENQKINNYSERLWIGSVKNQKVSHIHFLGEVKKSLAESGFEFNLLNEWSEKRSSYTDSGLIFAYKYKKMKWLVYMQIYAAPKSLGLAIYEMVIPNAMSEQEAEKKSRAFIEKHAYVVEQV